MSKHAPQAPGARPNTFWKQQRIERRCSLNAAMFRQEGIPPIYTRPEPNDGRTNKTARAELFKSLGLR